METTREEALDLLRGWASNRARVLCVASMNGIRSLIVGRVTATDDQVSVVCDGNVGEIVLPLLPALTFAYVDERFVERKLPHLNYEDFECSLLACLQDQDVIFFLIKDDTDEGELRK